MNNNDRPLSPHISIYRWPVTMVTSILHRATGVAMAVGFLVLVGWLFDAASGPEVYDKFVGVMDTTIGCILLVGWSFAFFVRVRHPSTKGLRKHKHKTDKAEEGGGNCGAGVPPAGWAGGK